MSWSRPRCSTCGGARAPGTGHRIVGQAAYGEVLRTLEHKGIWVHVGRQPDGPGGWVALPQEM
ncbi:MAG: SH3 domain-containing protein [Burkholderiales bacterium]|nr:SH3 domain-containing protein [Burkholderiales bacterium]